LRVRLPRARLVDVRPLEARPVDVSRVGVRLVGVGSDGACGFRRGPRRMSIMTRMTAATGSKIKSHVTVVPLLSCLVRS